MCEIVILFVHLIATLFRQFGPGGVRFVVAESVLVKHQLLIDNRSRQRSPNLRVSDRLIAGLCALLMPQPADPIRDRSEANSLSVGLCFRMHSAFHSTRYFRRTISNWEFRVSSG
jgi:hypothetical protein